MCKVTGCSASAHNKGGEQPERPPKHEVRPEHVVEFVADGHALSQGRAVNITNTDATTMSCD